MLRQLKKPNKEEKEPNNNSNILDNDELIQRLRFQGNSTTPNGRKRASDESDDSATGTKQRPGDSKAPSKLQERNKMLASLLANPTKPPTVNPLVNNINPIRIIPDIPAQQQNRLSQLQNLNNNNSSTINKNNQLNKNNSNSSNVKQMRQQAVRTNNNTNNTKPSENIYLNHHMQTPQHPNMLQQHDLNKTPQQSLLHNR